MEKTGFKKYPLLGFLVCMILVSFTYVNADHKDKEPKIKKTAEEETENTVWKNENFKEIVLDQ